MNRKARVAVIRQQVEAGAYPIDPEAIAEAMLRRGERILAGEPQRNFTPQAMEAWRQRGRDVHAERRRGRAA